jgi:metal-responsive CopG/Arc/MetJ family transcriptional regulator
MKTAVSVDDALMEQADQAARDLGLSRSALVAEALRAFLRQLQQAQVTEQLNRVYTDEPNPGERRLVKKLRLKLPIKDAW